MLQRENIANVPAATAALASDDTVLVLIDGQLRKATPAQVADIEFTVPNDSISTPKLVNGAVTNSKIADNAVTNSKIADGAVTTAKVTDSAITNSKIAGGAVTTAKVTDGAITESKIADGSVTRSKIDDGAVTNSKIDDGAVTESKIAGGAVTTAKVNDGAITRPKIADGAVSASKIENNAVVTSKIANNSVTTAKIADRNVNGYKTTITYAIVGCDGAGFFVNYINAPGGVGFSSFTYSTPSYRGIRLTGFTAGSYLVLATQLYSFGSHVYQSASPVRGLRADVNPSSIELIVLDENGLPLPHTTNISTHKWMFNVMIIPFETDTPS